MDTFSRTSQLAGRVLVGVFFLFNGVNHFMSYANMVGYASSKGVPLPGVAVIGSGVLLLLGGLSLLLGYKPRLGVLALTVFLVPTNLIMHNFWAVEGQAQMMEMIQFMKNTALLGFGWVLLALPEPWAFSLDAKLAAGEERSPNGVPEAA